MTIRDDLRQNNNGDAIQCFVQYPLYSDIDEAILNAADIAVLEDPYAFLELDHQSIGSSFSPNIPVREIVLDIARLAVLIWNKVRSEEEALQT